MKSPTTRELVAALKVSQAEFVSEVNADAAEEAALRAEAAEEAARAAADKIPKPDPRDDPRTRDFWELAEMSEEKNALARLNPRRNRWPEVVAFDQRADELGLRQQEIAAAATDVRARIEAATDQDRQALVQWTLNGGDKPAPTVEPLQKELASLEAEIDAAGVAIGTVLREKIRYVEKHGHRLARTARKATEKARDRCLKLAADLEEARGEVIAWRHSEVWALTFPHPATAEMHVPFPAALCGGLKRPVREAAPMLSRGGGQVQWSELRALLEADAHVLAEIASPAQRRVFEGDDGLTPEHEAMWHSDPRAERWRRQQRDRARALAMQGHDSSKLHAETHEDRP